VSKRTKSSAQPCARQRGWSNQELAQLHRAARILDKNGLRLDSDHGVTDEGDPWLVFCEFYSGDVIAHFARTGSEYIVCAYFLRGMLRSRDFANVIRRFIDLCPTPQVAHLGRAPSNGQVSTRNLGSLAQLVHMRSMMARRVKGVAAIPPEK